MKAYNYIWKIIKPHIDKINTHEFGDKLVKDANSMGWFLSEFERFDKELYHSLVTEVNTGSEEEFYIYKVGNKYIKMTTTKYHDYILSFTKPKQVKIIKTIWT